VNVLELAQQCDAATLTNEAVISDALCKEPEIAYSTANGRVRLSRWRQFVGSYTVPALPAPLFVIQLAGKPDVRYWDRDGWSEATSFPTAASIIPAGLQTRWLVDGELDVMTFSLDRSSNQMRQRSQFNAMRFAFSDPLSAALSEQILCELYRGANRHDDEYLESLIDTLSIHIASDRSSAGRGRYPTSGSSSFRIHKVMNAIMDDPAKTHSLSELADLAGITESHLCRVFKQSVGLTLHSYLLKVRLDRARQLLSCPDLSIGHVAEYSGFSGASQFTRVFRQYVNETPTSYRNRIVGSHLQ
jgi:AraC family transcriptional regulator